MQRDKYLGDKALSWLAQYDAGHTDMLAPLTLLHPDQDLEEILEQFPNQFDSRGLIVRPSFVNDGKYGVDLLKTHHVRNKTELTLAIEDIKLQATQPEVVDFAQWEGNTDYDGRVAVMIQPMMRDDTGIIAQHPNRKGVFVLNNVYVDPHDDLNYSIYQGFFGKDGKVIEDNAEVLLKYEQYNLSNLAKGPTNGSFLHTSAEVQERFGNDYRANFAGFMEKVLQAGFEDPANASIVEYGVPCVDQHTLEFEYETSTDGWATFFQQRRLLPFNWIKIPGPHTIYGEFTEERREFPVIEINWRSIKTGEYPVATEPSAYIFKDLEQTPPTFRPDNMAVFVAAGNNIHGDTLSHNTLKWVQRAQTSVLYNLYDLPSNTKNAQTGQTLVIERDNVRIK